MAVLPPQGLALKVLCAISSAAYGGAESLFAAILGGLKSKGVRAFVACPPQGPMLAAYRTQAAGLEHFDFSRPYDPRTALALERWRRECGAGLVQTILWNADAVAAAASRLCRPRDRPALVSYVVGAYHLAHGASGASALRRSALARVYRGVYRSFDMVLAVSEFVKSDLYARPGLKPPMGRVRVVYPGFEPPPRTERPRNPIDGRVVCIANLNAVKGHETLLRAFALVVSRHPEAGLSIIGDGPERGRLEALAERLALKGKVRFHGSVKDQMSHLEEAEAFVLPSLSEGFGLSVLEAWSTGVPVVASRAGGLPELVEDGTSGLLTDPGDPTSLADGITAVLGSADLRRALSAGGRRALDSRWSVDRMTGEILRAYADVLAPRD